MGGRKTWAGRPCHEGMSHAPRQPWRRSSGENDRILDPSKLPLPPLVQTSRRNDRPRTARFIMHVRFSFLLIALAFVTSQARAATEQTEKPGMPGGELKIVGKQGVTGTCPLKHTDVKADVAGFVARGTVKQSFHNPSTDKIEAVYVFPLPDDSAVPRWGLKVRAA